MEDTFGGATYRRRRATYHRRRSPLRFVASAPTWGMQGSVPGVCKSATSQSDCYGMEGCTVRSTTTGRGWTCVARPYFGNAIAGFSVPCDEDCTHVYTSGNGSVYVHADSDDEYDHETSLQSLLKAGSEVHVHGNKLIVVHPDDAIATTAASAA